MQSFAADVLSSATRVVIKIGSALLVDAQTGVLRSDWLDSVVADVVALRAEGKQVVLVSSGAIALGRRELGLGRAALRLDESQAAAAAGQIRLAHAFTSAFEPHALTVAQILLTLDDTERRNRYLNARRTMHTLLALGALPVVNENDRVATEEIRYGDNDRLAARVAQMIAAECLVLLSDVDGLYSANPQVHADASFIPRVENIDGEIEAMAGDSRSSVGSGGMRTKIIAAKIAVAAGCSVVLANGRVNAPLEQVKNGARHTYFVAKTSPIKARKQWIAGSLEPRGSLIIDSGAEAALIAGKSLLAAGVTAVRGTFGRGDPVYVISENNHDLAVGLCSYDSAECAQLKGCRSGQIEARLGYRGRDEMIHRDDLVLSK